MEVSMEDDKSLLDSMSEQAKADRKRNLKIQELERKIAEILEVEVEKIEYEWGWQRKEDGTRFCPASNGGDVAALIAIFRLDIHHKPRDPVRGYADVSVTHIDEETGLPTLMLLASEFSNSLPRTICEAAVMIAERGY